MYNSVLLESSNENDYGVVKKKTELTDEYKFSNLVRIIIIKNISYVLYLMLILKYFNYNTRTQ